MPTYDLQRHVLLREGQPCLTVRLSLPVLPDCPAGEAFYSRLGEACLAFCRERLLASHLLERDETGRQPTLRYSFGVRVTYESEALLGLCLHTVLRDGSGGRCLAEHTDGHVMERVSGRLVPPNQALRLLGDGSVRRTKAKALLVEDGTVYELREGRRIRLCALSNGEKESEQTGKKAPKSPCKKQSSVI